MLKFGIFRMIVCIIIILQMKCVQWNNQDLWKNLLGYMKRGIDTPDLKKVI